MEQHLCAASGPAHVLFLLHPPVHQLVHSRLHPRCRYAMAFAVFPAAALESYTYVEPPIIGPIQAANFGSLIPTESRRLSPEICCHEGQRGTGQIRRKVKEDENGIGMAGGRNFSSTTGGGGRVANK